MSEEKEYRYYLIQETMAEWAYRFYSKVDIPKWGVKAGDMGGIVGKDVIIEDNGTIWIDKTSVVEGNTRISGETCVLDGSTLDGNMTLHNATIHKSRLTLTDSHLERVTMNRCELTDVIDIVGDIRLSESFLHKCMMRGSGEVHDSRMKNVIIMDEFNLNGCNLAITYQMSLENKQQWTDVNLIVNKGHVEEELVMSDVDISCKEFQVTEKGTLRFVKTEERIELLRVGTINGTIESSQIIGLSTDMPVTLKGNAIKVQSTSVIGNVVIDGDVSLVKCLVEGYARVKMYGELSKSKILEFSTIELPLFDRKALSDITLSGDAVFSN